MTTSPGAATPLFRGMLRGTLAFDARTGLILLAVFSVTRIALVLTAIATRSYQLVSIFFVIMALTPWLLLGRDGQVRIGLRSAPKLGGLGLAIGLGMAWCAVMVASAWWLFGPGEQNAFTYIGASYPVLPPAMSEGDRLIYFAIFALIGMTFSPIGEEIFYRGLVHETFVEQFGERRAGWIDAAAFAGVHLAHFGLVWQLGGWALLPLPALWWLGGMFVTALGFGWARRASGSVWGAVAAHAAFNLVMTAWIFHAVL